MRKGQLVMIADAFLDNISMSRGPYVVIRSPYMVPSTNVIKGTKITRSVRCVDLLDPSGSIVKSVACEILKKA
jgi:hypothetical protein